MGRQRQAEMEAEAKAEAEREREKALHTCVLAHLFALTHLHVYISTFYM